MLSPDVTGLAAGDMSTKAAPVGASRLILVTDDGYGKARGALAAVRALALGGYRPVVALSAPFSLAGSSRYVAGVVRIPASSSDRYDEALRRESSRGEFATVLSTSDRALEALRAPGREFIDKRRLAKAALKAGIGSPPSSVFDDGRALLRDAQLLDYPLVVKPVAGHPTRRAEGPRDVQKWADRDGPLLVQPWLQDEQRGIAGVIWNGELIASVHQRHLRLWPPDCGMTCAAETIARDFEMEEHLVRLLGSYNGIFQADFAGPYLLDLNARVYASLSLAVAAGVNLAALHCDLVTERDVEPQEARRGVRFRWLDADLRRLVVAWRRKEMTAPRALWEMLPRPGTVFATESLRDPGPSFARARHVFSDGRWRRSSGRARGAI